jgi:hypothetical protein
MLSFGREQNSTIFEWFSRRDSGMNRLGPNSVGSSLKDSSRSLDQCEEPGGPEQR